MSEKLEVGMIVDGKIVKIKPFGAIISVDDKFQGLVHISQISDSFVQNIEEHLNVGDIVKVKVLSADEQTGKYALSIKDALPKSERPPKREYKPKDKIDKKTTEDDIKIERTPQMDLEDKIKDWLKASNERHAGINKRNNRR